jgi:hypothetical protein
MADPAQRREKAAERSILHLRWATKNYVYAVSGVALAVA